MTKRARLLAQQTFLETFSRTGIIRRGCEAAKVDRSTVDYWNEHDEDFGLHYGQARREADDAIRGEVYRRAVEGVVLKRTVRRRNEKGTLVIDRVEDIRQFSDQLLMFLAKSRMPEFKENERVQLVFDDEALGVIVDIIARTVTDEDTLSRLRAELARLASS